MSSARSQLKIAGTQKCSPFPPLRTPSFPLPKNKECYFSLGGDRGHPFAQHCSCPAILSCSIGLTKAAFLGTIFVWEKWLPQSHRDKPCAQSTRRQRPCCRPLQRCISSSKMIVPLTQVALVARPCAPAAQLTEYSSRSSRRLAISLCPLRSHLILSKTAPSVCLLQNENGSIKSFGQIDSS